MRHADATGRGRLRAFLSYASQDRAAVLELRERLQAAGVDAWMDDKLLPGQEWRLEIDRALRESDVVLACLSRVSLAKEGYVQKELRVALDRQDEKPPGTIFVIPVLLDACKPEGRLADLQQVRLWDPDGFPALLRALAKRAEGVGTQPPSLPGAPSERGSGVLAELTVPEKRILLMLLERTTPAPTLSVVHASGVHRETAQRYVERLSTRDPALITVKVALSRGAFQIVEHALTAEGRRVAAALQAV
jgi:hypothetical protein